MRKCDLCGTVHTEKTSSSIGEIDICNRCLFNLIKATKYEDPWFSGIRSVILNLAYHNKNILKQFKEAIVLYND